MELHSFWFEFVCPWWERTVQKPEDDKFRHTFRCINTIGDPGMRKMRTEQVNAGILAGYKQIIKLSEILLSVQVLFAALTDPKRGPALSREVFCLQVAQNGTFGVRVHISSTHSTHEILPFNKKFAVQTVPSYSLPTGS